MCYFENFPNKFARAFGAHIVQYVLKGLLARLASKYINLRDKIRKKNRNLKLTGKCRPV